MTDQPYNRTVIYPLEKPLADDLNQQFSQQDRALRDTLFNLLDGQEGFIRNGFLVQAASPADMSVVMSSGIGFQDDGTDVPSAINSVIGLDDLSRYKPIVLALDKTIAVPTAPGANSRIDLIEVRYNRETNNLLSRQFLNTVTNAFAPANVAKTLDFSLDDELDYYAAADVPTTAIAYKSGVVAGSPVAPAVDTGYIAVAYITVGTGVVVINSGDIEDARSKIVLNPGGYIGRRKFTANDTYVPSEGCRKIVLRMCGGGGGGGDAGASVAGQGTAASGGSSGVYVEWALTGTPILGGAVVIGAGGAASTNGGDTTVDINGVTITAKGGLSGVDNTNDAAPPVMTVGVGIQAGSSAGDIVAGDPGGFGLMTGSVISSTSSGGNGGSGRLGTGGLGGESNVGGAASGYGGGGGGGATWQDASARVGGAGSPGVVIIDEYY
jgi:hypothetical protein